MNNLKNTSAKITMMNVKSAEEFDGADVIGRINILVPKLKKHISKLQKMENIVLCCASGT
ncbi:MAG: hypothetical protein RIQ33_940 [Bacteroidota bacterium]|jgi:rhodanese-related sulfurtransferase